MRDDFSRVMVVSCENFELLMRVFVFFRGMWLFFGDSKICRLQENYCRVAFVCRKGDDVSIVFRLLRLLSDEVMLEGGVLVFLRMVATSCLISSAVFSTYKKIDIFPFVNV